MAEEKEPASHIIERDDSQAPPVSQEFQAQLDTWAAEGCRVSQAKGGTTTRVFVEEGAWTHIFDENGNRIRSTTR